jgi:MFS family permease
MTDTSGTGTPAPTVGNPRKAALAAWIGSALEYYDFFIYGTAAALVFGQVFFADSDPFLATLLAIATFGVGYLARPLGALVLGHMGDRFGRKRVLVLTVLLMGVSTFIVGCLPGYAEIGPLAPVFLVLMRLLQGFSAGGEQSGANSMTLEHAPEGRRAYFTSFTMSGTQAGQILATAVFIPVALLPSDQLLSWGWRIPFWLSALVVVAAFLIRRTLDETPAFEEEAAGGGVPKAPITILLREYWRPLIRVICASVIASVSTIFTVYALSYATSTVGLDRTAMLWVGVLANVVALITIPLWGRLADRVGRKPVFLLGSIGCAILMFAYLGSIAAGSYLWIFIVGIVMFGIIHSATAGVWPSYYAEWFPTRVRLTGIALGTQIGFAVAGFAPTIAAAVAGSGTGSWVIVAAITAGFVLINVIAIATAPETFRTKLSDLGARRPAERVGS